jgi:hypothetical protein
MISRYLTKKPIPSKKVVKTDPQVMNVYRMERLLMGAVVNHVAPLAHLQKVANYLCRKWGVRPPTVYAVRLKAPYERTFGLSKPGKIILNLNWHGCNMIVLLHELAHHIHANFDPDGEDYDHGPNWAAINGTLLDMTNTLPFYCYEAMCDKWGVMIGPNRFPEDFK